MFSETNAAIGAGVGVSALASIPVTNLDVAIRYVGIIRAGSGY